MIIFSLKKLEVFFSNLSSKQIFRIYLDTRKIRKAYRRKNGFIKSQKLTVEKILHIFFYYCDISNLDMYGKDALENWNEFVQRCTMPDGPNYVDWYL